MSQLDRLFRHLLNFIVLFAASMFAIPLAMLLFTSEQQELFVGAHTLMPILAVLVVFLGRGVQELFCLLTGMDTDPATRMQLKKGFIPFMLERTGIPLVLFLAGGVGVYALANLSYDALYSADKMLYNNELTAILTALFFFVCAFLGALTAYIRAEEIAGFDTLRASAIVFYAEMFLATLSVAPLFTMGFSVLSHPLVTKTIAFPCIAFTICIFIIYNQSNLLRNYHGSVVSVVTMSARFYNLYILLMLLLCLMLLCGIVYIVLKGLGIIGSAIAFVVAYKLFYGKQYDDGSYHPDYVYGDDASREFQKSVMSPDNQYMLAMFFLLLLSVAAIVVLARTGYLRRMITAFRTWWRDLIDALLGSKDLFKNITETNEIYNYKDEKKRLQNASIRDFDALAADTDTYKLFMQRLGRLKSYEEQLCFAYAVLLRMYKKININLKISDTPREVEAKVQRAIASQEIEAITADFEKIRYAAREVTDAEAARILSTVCGVVKRYMF